MCLARSMELGADHAVILRVESDVMIDPVCGMNVEPGKAAAKHEYNGETYLFAAITAWEGSDRSPRSS
jgi:YHS domain-containing protein